MTVACPGRETENIEREPLASWWAERIALALRRVRCCFDACPGHNHPSLNTNLRNYARDRYGTGLSQPVAGRDHLLPDTHSKKYRNDPYCRFRRFSDTRFGGFRTPVSEFSDTRFGVFGHLAKVGH